MMECVTQPDLKMWLDRCKLQYCLACNTRWVIHAKFVTMCIASYEWELWSLATQGPIATDVSQHSLAQNQPGVREAVE